MNSLSRAPAREELVAEMNVPSLIESVLRRWRFIAAVVAALGLVVAVVNFFVLPARYESSATLIYSNGNASSGINFQLLQSIVSSPSLMEEVERTSGEDPRLLGARGEYRSSADERTATIVLSVTANSPEASVMLLEHWIEGVRTRVRRLLEERLAQQIEAVDSKYVQLKEELQTAEDRLAAFDREHPIALMETQLELEMRRVIADQMLFETLQSVTIPAGEATVDHLASALAREPRLLEPAIRSEEQARGSADSGEARVLLNPIYLELRRELALLEGELAATRSRAEQLAKDLSERQAQLRKRSDELSAAKLERERLQREVREVMARFEAVRAEREEVLAFERQLSELARVELLAEPFLPTAPVAPRRLRNVAISVVMGFVASLFWIGLVEWWREATRVQEATSSS